jgi:uncharacterized membrane protein
MVVIGRLDPGIHIKEANLFFYEYRAYLILIANILIVSAYIPNNHVKKFIKHPMLLGILVWSFSHIMFNQNLNHLILFSTFSIFSILMIIGINLRDKKIKTKSISFKYRSTFIVLTLGITCYTISFYTHKYIAGVSIN